MASLGTHLAAPAAGLPELVGEARNDSQGFPTLGSGGPILPDPIGSPAILANRDPAYQVELRLEDLSYEPERTWGMWSEQVKVAQGAEYPWIGDGEGGGGGGPQVPTTGQIWPRSQW